MKSLVYIAILVASFFAGAAFYKQTQDLHRTRDALSTLQASAIDIGFSQAMSLHHRQAIAMAQLMLDGRPTGLAGLANSIASTQLVELGEMRGWLRLWAKPLRPSSDNMAWMLLGEKPLTEEISQYLIDCRSAPGGMQGLASQHDLSQLM